MVGFTVMKIIISIRKIVDWILIEQNEYNFIIITIINQSFYSFLQHFVML